jgi:hypothetical protein
VHHHSFRHTLQLVADVDDVEEHLCW